ncbi:hypothetical protein GGD41_001852 [Paraburkholderia bryophila]|uniref:Aspartyl protease n=1 Tax=Paraburkholderia bryophila TaxID=420952 RepID=A0A7Y9W5G0_9BURK|nr:hypothetical protein [Paraburkholderia bryophila]
MSLSFLSSVLSSPSLLRARRARLSGCTDRRAFPRRRSLAPLLATAVFAVLSGCSTTFPTPTPPASTAALINGGADGLLIPLHVERADEDHARLGLPVQLDGKPLYVALDTGTQGVRVLKSALPGADYPNAGPGEFAAAGERRADLRRGGDVADERRRSQDGANCGAGGRTGELPGHRAALRGLRRLHG